MAFLQIVVNDVLCIYYTRSLQTRSKTGEFIESEIREFIIQYTFGPGMYSFPLKEDKPSFSHFRVGRIQDDNTCYLIH